MEKRALAVWLEQLRCFCSRLPHHGVQQLPGPSASRRISPSLQDFLPRVGQFEGHQGATDQGHEGQKNRDGFGDPHEAGEDGAAEDGCQLT